MLLMRNWPQFKACNASDSLSVKTVTSRIPGRFVQHTYDTLLVRSTFCSSHVSRDCHNHAKALLSDVYQNVCRVRKEMTQTICRFKSRLGIQRTQTADCRLQTWDRRAHNTLIADLLSYIFGRFPIHFDQTKRCMKRKSLKTWSEKNRFFIFFSKCILSFYFFLHK